MPEDNPFNKFSNLKPTPEPSQNPFDQFGPSAFPDLGKSKSTQPTQEENPFNRFGGQDTSLGTQVSNIAGNIISKIPGAQKTISTIAPALDVLSRPSYAVSRFIDAWSDEATKPLEAVSQAFTELFAGNYPGIGDILGGTNARLKITMSDVIRRREPEFAAKNPNATTILGFIGDVALDPLSWLGVGETNKVIKVAGSSLNKTATETFKELLPSISRKIYVAEEGTLNILDELPKVTQQAQRTANKAESFQKRIASSAVIDEDGELIPLYHGTQQAFKKFKDIGDVSGTYFSTLPEVAAYYAGESGNVIKAYSSAKKVLDLTIAPEEKLLNLSEKLGLPVEEGTTTNDIVNGIRNKLSTNPKSGYSNPLEGQKALVEQLKKVGYQGMKFMSDDGGTLHSQYLIFNNNNIIPAYTNKGVRAVEQVAKKTGSIGKLEKDTAILTNRGYFDAVREKQDEVINFLNGFVDKENKITPQFALEQASQEIRNDLTRTSKTRPRDVAFENEVYETMTDRIAKLVNTNSNIAKQILEPKGLYLKVGLPFTNQTPILRLFGTEYLAKKIKGLGEYIRTSDKIVPRTANVIGQVFSRDFALPEEYINFRNELENQLGYLSHNMTIQARKLFTDVSVEGREKIVNILHNADSETRKLEQIRSASSEPGFRNLTDGEAAQIFQESVEKFKATPQEFAILSSIQQDYKEAGLLEMRAGLLRYNLLNYSARGYQAIKDSLDMSIITRGKIGNKIPEPYLSSAKQRKFLTVQEAEEAGLAPELDAAVLYAHRILSSQRALAIKTFKDSVTELYGTYKTSGTIAHTGILPTTFTETGLPKYIVDDMKMIGQSIIPSGMNETQRQVLRVFDRLQGLWKRVSTTANPIFAPKQLVSNTFQSALIVGARAFKALDPRVAIDSAITMFRGGKPLEQLPEFLSNWLTKNFTGNQGLDSVIAGRVVLQRHLDDAVSEDFLNQFIKTTALGQKFSGAELQQLALENGIIRGFDTTGETFSKKVTESLERGSTSHANVVGVLTKVWNHASLIEDYSRMSLFLNGIGMGYSAKESTKLVNKALFDYQRGLSAIEKNIIKRIIPFYSFQRFAIPFVLKQTIQQPGNVATLNKLMATTEKLLISGEELTPAEVDIFNQNGENYLLDQPRLLSGFDKNGTATLNILNNFTPYDVLNMLQYDKQGNIDISRTAERTFMAALSPFLKLPITFAEKKDLFTGRTIEDASKISGNLDISLGKIIPDSIKQLMSWEVRKHEITGKVSTYINPFFSYYMMQFIPQLRNFMKPLSELDKVKGGFLKSGMYVAMNIFDPIKSQQYDFKYNEDNENYRLSKDLNDIESGFVKAKIRGDAIGTDSSFEFEDNQKKLQLLFQSIDERTKARQGTGVRGLGVGNVGEVPVGTTLPNDIPINQQQPNFR